MRAEGLHGRLADSCEIDHWVRVAALADALATRLGWDERRRSVARRGAVLHDIGKLTVSSVLLRKPGRLTEEEMTQIRRHPAAGAFLVHRLRAIRAALPCILFHHERWDGDGYPSGRAGNDIPLEARLLAVVDAFDAMVSDRPYRRALSIGEALDELERGAGTQFDPELAEEFVGWHRWMLRMGERESSRPAVTGSPRPRASTAPA